MHSFMVNILKKSSLKKIKYSRSLPDPENFLCGHQQPYNFFSVIADFQTRFRLLPIFNWFKVEKLAVTGDFFFFFWLSRKKSIRADQKNPYMADYWWAGIKNHSTILMIMKIYMFILLYFTLVLLLIMRNQPVSIAWQQHLQLHLIIVEVTPSILVDELDVIYIFDINIVYPYEICRFIWFLILLNVDHA